MKRGVFDDVWIVVQHEAAAGPRPIDNRRQNEDSDQRDADRAVSCKQRRTPFSGRLMAETFCQW